MLSPEIFQRHLQSDFPFLTGKKLLAAVSGGIDSMALAELMRLSDLDFSIAHCNFGLRGKESDSDAEFLTGYGRMHGIQVYKTSFDTKAYAADRKLSLQVAARALRYAWFEELRAAHGFDFILTAHQADDNIETFFINLSRGSGLDGLTGIPAQNGFVARPLLAFSRTEIEAFAKDRGLEWREDASNASDDYLRNRIRHRILPAFDELAPGIRGSVAKTMAYLADARELVADAAHIVYREVAVELDEKTLLRLPELRKLPHCRAYLYQWLKPYGFTAWDDIYDLVDAPSGRQVFSPGYVISKDRETLELMPRTEHDEDCFLIDEGQRHFSGPVDLRLETAEAAGENRESHIFVDRDALQFPLTLRRWRQGDHFRPLGMAGTKKVGKYFKDEKFALSDKRNAWLLCSANDIVWIVGHRADERFKVTPNTKHILRISTS